MERALAFVIAAVAALAGVGCGGSSPVQPHDDGGAPMDAGPDGFALAPGDVAELALDPSGTAGEKLPTPNGDEKYVVVLASTKLDISGSMHTYSFALDGAPNPAIGPSTVLTSCSLTSDPWSKTPIPSETPPSGAGPAMGDMKMIDVPTPAGFEAIQAQVIAVGQHTVVWSDTTNPTTLDAAFVQQFLTDFEQTILPRERMVFGMESDLDKDGHISLVFSSLTYQTAVAFFTGCDLLSLPGCASSNGGEYLYLTPPDAIAPPYNTPNAIKEILAHECSHLIHFNRKVLRNNLTDWSDSANMIEGIGGFAQDAVGYQAGNLYVTVAGLDGINTFSLGDDFVDFAQYDPPRDGVLRGGSYLFVRWLYDRAGGDSADASGAITSKGGPAILRALLDSKQSIAKTLPDATKSSLADLATDYYTALALSNRDSVGGVAPTNACFAYLPTVTDPVTQRQRGANLYAMFHGMMMNGPKVQPVLKADGKLRAGGVEYLEIDAQAGQPEIAFTLKVDPAAKPRARVGRLH